MTTTTNNQCGECGAMTLTEIDNPENYTVTSSCSNCGHEVEDSYADLYGAISVPWGFAL
jgi:DNA-directed RNA polymerase subunit M/transcription elongation factor TFIIS